MLSFFRPKPKAQEKTADPEVAQRQRMNLEERKAFRQEMLYQSVRETFLSMEVIGSMYKFKVMPVDERHHRFIAMIDVAKSFVTGKEARTKSFAAIEKLMRTNTYKRYGVLLEGTYWRVSESETQFEPRARAADAADTASAPSAVQAQQARKPPTPGAHPAAAPEPVMARQPFQPVSEEEAQAFMDAIAKGLAPPVVHVGDRDYQSDLAPLDSGIMIGGTQYGKL
jgi:hypothetical protein